MYFGRSQSPPKKHTRQLWHKKNLSLHYSDKHTLATANENPSPQKNYTSQKKLCIDDREDSVADNTISSLANSLSRPPLKPISINSHTDDMQPIRNRGPNQISRNQARTAIAKARRKAL